MIAKLHLKPRQTYPSLSEAELRNESDVEQKFIYPFLTHASFLGIPSLWVRTKEYMTPTEIDKLAGKRSGYVPDYSIWYRGLPLLMVEAKGPDVVIERALREARLYAGEINKRYPPGANPIGFILACNGVQVALSQWDSEAETVIFNIEDVGPGSAALELFRTAVGHKALEQHANALASHFSTRRFFSAFSFMGQGASALQLGVNEFAEPLFPLLSKYFAVNTDDVPDIVIDKAYVSTEEIGAYEGVLNTYLKDRLPSSAGNQLKAIEVTKKSASEIDKELSKFTANPKFFSRVQLIVGAVGAGKSTFIKRFYRRLLPPEIAKKTLWSFINFNVNFPEDQSIKNWIASQFIDSLVENNDIDLSEEDTYERIFSVEINKFERGPAKALKDVDIGEFTRRRVQLLEDLLRDPIELSKAISRHYSGERGLGIVVVFDNVDKRSRDDQLQIFEAAQWFKDITKGLILVNIRDTTFEAHRDEPPLDAFSNSINFYIRPPRFAQVIRKRLELVLELLSHEVSDFQTYTLESGARITYPASRLGEFLLNIYLSLFARRSSSVSMILEGLIAKDVRKALGMFADIIVSPHVPTSSLTVAALNATHAQLPEYVIIKSLMRGRYTYFNSKSAYIRNILHADKDHYRPSNFLMPDILAYLVRNRKIRVDYNQEGYASTGTVVKEMSRLGYDEDDAFQAIAKLVDWGLVEPESLVSEEIGMDDPLRIHASGFIHLNVLLPKTEYLVGISPDLTFSSREVAEVIGSTWANQAHRPDITLRSKQIISRALLDYFRGEYQRRCGRHAFYREHGHGGKAVLGAIELADEQLARVRS